MSEDRGITPAPKKKNTKPPYNPFKGQYYVDKHGNKIERNPSNSSARSGG
jgi:hypothetical protein